MAAVGTADDEGAECEYVGPGEHGNQVQVVNYLIDRLHVAGIGISPADPKDEKMEAALKRAKNEGIPVLTWDSDLQDKKLRKAYIGSDNYQMGVDLAKLVMEIKPSGGTIFIELGSDTSANHKERLKGIRDTLSGKGKKRATEDAPLKDENGWTEVDRPFYPEDSSITVRQVGEIRGENPNLQAVRKMDEILGKYPNLDAFVATGGFPEQLEREYKKVAGSIKSKIGSAPAAGHQLAAFKSGNESKLALVFGDTLPMQIYELKSGLASGNVGQRPFDMGYKVMYALKKIKDGKGPPSDPTYTELDICTSENVKTCIGRHR